MSLLGHPSLNKFFPSSVAGADSLLTLNDSGENKGESMEPFIISCGFCLAQFLFQYLLGVALSRAFCHAVNCHIKDLCVDKLRPPTNLQAMGIPVLNDLAIRPIWIPDLQKIIFCRSTLLRGNLR